MTVSLLVKGIAENLRVDDVQVDPLGRECRKGTTVRDAMRTGLKDARRLDVVAQDELVARLRSSALAAELKPWLDYHAFRYGW